MENDFSLLWRRATGSEERLKLLDAFQKIVDKTPKAEFDAFDGDANLSTKNQVLDFYDKALERILADVPATKVEPGTVAIWYLYSTRCKHG